MTNGQNAVRGRHLESLAADAKRFTLEKNLELNEAVQDAIDGINPVDFTGATSSAGGVSGLVPAPSSGDENKFLRGDGTWASVSGGGGGTHIDVGNLAVLESLPASSSDDGIWYEMVGAAPVLFLRKGNYDYGFNYNLVRYRGGNSNLVAYLPFSGRTSYDACGNDWVEVGDVASSTAVRQFGAASTHFPQNACIQAEMPFDFAAQKWTVDCWLYVVTMGDIFALAQDDTRRKAGLALYSDSFWFGTGSGWGHSHSFPFPLTTWFHVAVVKNDMTFYFFKDGALIWQTEETELPALDSSIMIGGSFYGGSGNSDFYCSSFRIFEGVALWTEDFIPPTAEDYV